MKNSNNPNINQEESRNNYSGNMYSFHDDNNNNNKNIQEAGAIRRSIGQGNPNIINIPQNNFGSGYEQNYENNKPEYQYSQDNNYYAKDNSYYWFPYLILGCIEALIIIILSAFFEYKFNFDELNAHEINVPSEIDDDVKNIFEDLFYNYGLLRDMNIMVFIGFGMLHSILKRSSWIIISINMLLIAISIQMALFFNFLWKNAFNEVWKDEYFNFDYLMKAIFVSSSVVISLGSVIGKLSMIQYIIMAIFETILCSLNYQLCEEKLQSIDHGGSLYIHTFGGIFSIAISVVLFCSTRVKSTLTNYNHLNKSNYFSNLTSYLGMIILFCYFPSFNSALAKSRILRHRGRINTYFSLFGSGLTSFIISGLYNGGRFVFEEILYGSISGAIIISGCCTVCIYHWASLIIGTISAIITVSFLSKIKPFFVKHGLQDTCNVLIVHGISGILGGFLTPIFIRAFRIKNESIYKDIFLRACDDQAGIQIGAIFLTIGMAFFGGIAIGYLIKISQCGQIYQYFTDSEFFIEEENNIFEEFNESSTNANIDINNPSLFPAYNNQGGKAPMRISRPSY